MRRLPLAAAGREGRFVCRSCAACWRAPYRESWQPPAGRAGLCADLMRRLLAGALQRELAAAGREGRLVCRSHAPPVGGRLTEDLARRLLAGAEARSSRSRMLTRPALS